MAITVLYPTFSVLLFFSHMISPQFGSILALFSPLFLVLYFESGLRNKWVDASYVLLIAIISVAKPLPAAYYVLSALVPAVIMLVVHRTPKGNAALSTLLAPLPLAGVITAILMFLPEQRAAFTQTIQDIIGMMTTAPANVQTPSDEAGYLGYIRNNAQAIADQIVAMLPAINFIYVAIVVYLTEKIYSRQEKDSTPAYRLPDALVWVLIVAGFAFAFKFAPFYTLTTNLMLIFCALYFFQGLDIIIRFFEKIRMLRILRFFFYLFVFTEPPFIIAISLIGLFSIWIKFKPKTAEK